MPKRPRPCDPRDPLALRDLGLIPIVEILSHLKHIHTMRFPQMLSGTDKSTYQTLNGMEVKCRRWVTGSCIVRLPPHMMLRMAPLGTPFVVHLPSPIRGYDNCTKYALDVARYMIELHGFSSGVGATPLRPTEEMRWNTPSKEFTRMMTQSRGDGKVHISDIPEPWNQGDLDLLPANTTHLCLTCSGVTDEESSFVLPQNIEGIHIENMRMSAGRWLRGAMGLCLVSLQIDDFLYMENLDDATPAMCDLIHAQSDTLEELYIMVDDQPCELLFIGCEKMKQLTCMRIRYDGCEHDMLDTFIVNMLGRCPNLESITFITDDTIVGVSRIAFAKMISAIPRGTVRGYEREVDRWDLRGATLYGGTIDIGLSREGLACLAQHTHTIYADFGEHCNLQWNDVD